MNVNARSFWLAAVTLCLPATSSPAQSAGDATKSLPVPGEVFTVEGRTAFLIRPDTPSTDAATPWVFYAPTLPRLPGPEEQWMFDRFLAAGIAIAGIDAGESFGSPTGRAIYSALYSELTKHRGLTPRACLLARSRGGLMLYNWAVEHPEAVACVAGIYPVCNLASYPGLARACGAYAMSEAQLATALAAHNPIDRLAPLAAAQVPIFHLHGDRDRIVPLTANSAALARRYRELGGPITLEVVEGQGHNMWRGWFESAALVDFVIKHARPNPRGATRIACLGDSITYGSRVVDRKHNSYPAQLGSLLGAGFEVRNFGVGGATLLRAADRPYEATERCKAAVDWAPHIAVIALGTNDSCQNERRKNWQHAENLEADARALVQRLQAARADVRVLLCSPPPMFSDKSGLTPARRDNLRERSPRLRRVAEAARAVAAATDGVEYVELSRVLRAADVTDGVHTTPFGAERLARRVAEAIRGEQRTSLGIASALRERGIAVATTAFHEFAGWSFALPKSGARCRIVLPHGVAHGAPWILRARFFGHQPALDLALLERGFHLTYCDVSHLYGAPAAIERWNEFYDLLRELGLGPKPVLEGMSRGGLPIINWAAAHPERVAAIYGDNPVADFRSWPGGHSGKRSDADWRRCLAAYGLDEQQAGAFDRMPVDRLASIAAAKVPLLLVLGGADTVVPPAENGELLVSRYRILGGPVQVWRKPNAGHHPHGLHPVEPLLRAVLQPAVGAVMPSVEPAPSAEYRDGAGWGGGSWWSQLDAMRTLAAAHPTTPIVFLGDSITQGLTGAANRTTTTDGKRAIDVAFGQLGAMSLGLSGDRTEHLLFRIRHGALATLAPQIIVLQIGVNNINSGGHTASETAAGIEAVLASLGRHEPQARVILCGPFPCGARGTPRRRAIDRVHELIRAFGDEQRVFYRDLRPLFLDENESANDRMRGDQIHITTAGQQAWMAAIAPLAEELMQRRQPAKR